MTDQPQIGDLTLAEAARLAEENAAEFLLAMGRAGGGEERHDPELSYTIGGSPIAYHNAVVRANLPADRADAAIDASLALMRAKGVAGSWHVGPSMRPLDLGARLRARGLVGGPEPAMAADLDRLAEVASPAGLSVEPIVARPGLDAYAAVLAEGFGEGPPEAAWVREVFGRIGLDDAQPWRHFLGRLEGQPVATASLFLAAGVAGLYFVSTAPRARRRGVGAAITRAALEAARALGFRTAVLGASPMGEGVYRRLGFVDVATIEVYEADGGAVPAEGTTGAVG